MSLNPYKIPRIGKSLEGRGSLEVVREARDRQVIILVHKGLFGDEESVLGWNGSDGSFINTLKNTRRHTLRR